MMSTSKSYLPVPEFYEQNLSLTFKQHNSDSFRNSKRPPKLYPKHHDLSFNKSLNTSSVAHAISFNDFNTASTALLSPIYKVDNTESYFEQCFDMLSKLGEGSFGEVFKVRSREDGMLYAVKKSKQYYRSEYNRQERLEEVRRYEQFSEHEHCITLYRAWEQDDRLYMQMELCQGSLEAYVIEQKNLSEAMTWNVLLDLLLALKALHDKNLIHLDIKLDNILIDYDNVCKLGDFGLMVDSNKENIHNATEGDCRYIAPELLYGQFSKAADIFSSGITILELACNLELPRNGPLWQQLRSGNLPPECLGMISKDLEYIIQWMMNPDPLKRPDVNSLLVFSKIQDLLKRRLRWLPVRRMKKYPMDIGGFIWQTVNRFKNMVSHLYSRIMALIKLQYTKNGHHEQPENQLLLLDDSEIECSPSKQSPRSNSSSMAHIINSTPLNHHGSFRRSRLELSRTSLLFDNDNSLESSPSQYSNNCTTAKTQDSTSFICKKLFFKPEDSD